MVLFWLEWKLLVTQSCSTLWDPMDYSPPDSSVHGILQARILELVAIPLSRESSWCRDRTRISCIAGRFFTVWATKEDLSGWGVVDNIGWPRMGWFGCVLCGLPSRLASGPSYGWWEGFWESGLVLGLLRPKFIKTGIFHFHCTVLTETNHRNSSDSKESKIDFNYLWKELWSHTEKNCKYRKEWAIMFFSSFCNLIHGKEGSEGLGKKSLRLVIFFPLQ